MFYRAVTLDAGERLSYDAVFAEPTEKTVVYHATADLASGVTTERTFAVEDEVRVFQVVS